MHGPAKTASLEIGFEGSNPSLHAKCSFGLSDTIRGYEPLELGSTPRGNTRCVHSQVAKTAGCNPVIAGSNPAAHSKTKINNLN